MAIVIQRSFSGGEISPSLYARVDYAKYATSARTLRNSYVLKHGGTSNRPGTQFISEVSDSSAKVRLIPFVFNASQTYVLEFGNQYMRVIKAGAQVTETAVNISGATQANPVVITTGTHGYTTGDEVYISGVGGMTQLNNRNFKITVLSGTTFSLQLMDGTTDLDGTGFDAYTSGGTSAKIYEIATDYVTADLPTLQFVQSADIVTITHPTYPVQELARTGDASWTLTDVTFSPSISRPTSGGTSSITAGSNEYRWRITAVKEETYEESLPGYGHTVSITGATQANPVVITTGSSHAYITGDEVVIESITGMVELNNRKFIITVLSGTTFSLDGEDGTGHTAYSSGGQVSLTYIKARSVAAPTAADPHVITWGDVSGAIEYNVYQSNNGIYGLIGTAGLDASFNVIGTEPDTSLTPPIERDVFNAVDGYPSAVTYFQQRLMFANTNDEPEKIWGSRSGNFKNFTVSSPLQDDDAVTFTMAGRQVNSVKHMLDLGSLVVLTEGGEWSVTGNDAGILKPTDINPKQYDYNGSGDLSPIVVGGNALFVQARGSIVRDLGFDFQIDGYRGNDLTILSSHLFEGYTLTDWTYQKVPHSVVWAVRSDGALLGLTYVREQQMYAWHRHDFQGGVVENVVAVPEGQEDKLYLVVKRTIDGGTKRYIERMSSRFISDTKDMTFMDSYLGYDGRNSDTNHTMTLSGGTDWIYTETLTLTSSASYFASTDVGDEIHLTGSDGTIIRFSIVAYSSATVVTGKPNKTVPASMRSTAISSWSKAVDQVTGLWHIEGEDVSVFGDSFVVASPNNASYDTVMVSDGTVTLDKAYSVIYVGLPYISDIETLDIDTLDGSTMADKNKLITSVTMFVESTRGVWLGSKPPTSDTTDPLEGLRELKLRQNEDYDSPVSLTTGPVDINIKGEWNNNGRVFVRQVDPVPMSVLAIAPAGKIPRA